MNDTKQHLMCDPVHKIMSLDSETMAVIKDIIDTKVFQRLRHIKQLNFADYAYPGAVHTRFNHCIGSSYLASKLCKSLHYDKEISLPIIIAALLHDIGHGPFSHAFEKIYPGNKKISHESWNDSFIKEILGQLKGSPYVKYIEDANCILNKSCISCHQKKKRKKRL